MHVLQEKLFLELRQTKEEIEISLKTKRNQEWLTAILKEELEDIETAIKKLDSGSFGQCEISGELLPVELLKSIPTLKTLKDTEKLGNFYRKTINSPY